MERSEVFVATHRLLLDLIAKGRVTGLRIDHPDGLWDPKEYFRRLQLGFLERISASEGGEQLDAALHELEQKLERVPIPPDSSHRPEGPPGDTSRKEAVRRPWPLYVVAEKILSDDEPLRRDWPVEGTTGYDFLNQVNGLFVNSANAAEFDRLYQEFSGNYLDFRESAYQGKKQILERVLVAELSALTHRLKGLTARTRSGQDFTFRQLHRALAEVIATFPVYRTYITEDTERVIPVERAYVEGAIGDAKARNKDLDSRLLDFLQDLLLLRFPPDLGDEGERRGREFIMRFQQLSGPATAKGLEDTAFYNYNRLVSLNEVGGDPGRFGTSVQAFHQHNLLKAEHWPHALLATATHDTKRGEDVRARLNVLSEMPDLWRASLERWSQLNRTKKPAVEGGAAPDPNDEYLLYQILVGSWPFQSESADAQFQERIVAYMNKALKEAKAHTSWTDPNSAYEEGVSKFIQAILHPDESRSFLEDLADFQRTVAFFGQWNSLAQLLLKVTSPGVPDFYQGTELWDLSLVDPDNRRPVDFKWRRQMLEQIKGAAQPRQGVHPDYLARLQSDSHTGEMKFFVTYQALALRERYADLFKNGSYLPLETRGAKAVHACAFARLDQGQVVLVVVPRLVFGLTSRRECPPLGIEVWQDTSLMLGPDSLAGRYKNVFTGEEITCACESGLSLPMRAVLNRFPVALLERISPV